MEGRICVCRRTGCLEHFFSIEGLSHDYDLLTENKLTAENIMKLAETSDIVAESAIQVIYGRISRGLAMVIGLPNPEIILIFGMLAESERLFTNIPRKWPCYIRSSVNSDVLISLPISNPCPNHLYLHGAALLCDYAR